jgi:hypothetical protein
MTPPLISGQWDKTRFDSVDAQNDYFFGGVWLPLLDKMQSFYQKIIDSPYFRSSTGERVKCRMSKSMQERFEKARINSKSDFVVILDPDQIPAVAKLKQHKIEYAQKLISTFHMTPRAACDELGLDLELNTASDMVWYDSNQKYIEDKPTAPVTPAAVPVEETVTEKTSNVLEESLCSVAGEKELMESIKTFYRSYRPFLFSHLDKNEFYSLSEVDTLADKYGIKYIWYKELRKDYMQLREMKDKEAIKAYLNKRNNSNIRKIIKGN